MGAEGCASAPGSACFPSTGSVGLRPEERAGHGIDTLRGGNRRKNAAGQDKPNRRTLASSRRGWRFQRGVDNVTGMTCLSVLLKVVRPS